MLTDLNNHLATTAWRAPAGTPIPGLSLAVDRRDGALVRVEILASSPPLPPPPLPPGSTAACELALEAIAAYLAGTTREIRVRYRLPSNLPPTHRAALEVLATIPYGATLTYGDLANRIGRPQAARAVGSAMARNPLPLVLPCHRVVAAGGKLGGFGPGVHLKEALLAHEARHATRS